VGLRLTKRGAGELQYKPRVQFPFMPELVKPDETLRL
jgi:hypothetical protein